MTGAELMELATELGIDAIADLEAFDPVAEGDYDPSPVCSEDAWLWC